MKRRFSGIAYAGIEPAYLQDFCWSNRLADDFETVLLNMCNVPLASGCGGEEFRDAVTQVWMPRLREFKPQMILISAGFDAHFEDDMGNLKFLEKDYAWVTDQLKTLAAEMCNKRVVSMLEGGYVMTSLARSVGAHLRSLADL